MNYNDSDSLILTNDLSFRMMVRIGYMYFFIASFFIQLNMGYLSFNNVNHRFSHIYNHNFNLIVFINVLYLGTIILSYINANSPDSETYLKLIINFISLTDIILKGLCTVINSTVMAEPEFQFISFYLWNVVLLINIYLSYLLNLASEKQKKNIPKLPGIKLDKESKENLCSICLENNSDWKLPCGHTYHYTCCQKWYEVNKSCPYCRHSL